MQPPSGEVEVAGPRPLELVEVREGRDGDAPVQAWLAAFLPAGLGALSAPAVPPDRNDPHFVHLDGLSLSRAWALRRLASGRAPDDFTRACSAASERHLAAGLPQAVGGDYVAEHWLATFAALALGDIP